MTKKLLVILLAVLLSAFLVSAANAAAIQSGTIVKFEGKVDILKNGRLPAVKVKGKEALFDGDIIRTKSGGKVEIEFNDGSVARLGERSRLDISSYGTPKDGKKVITLKRGKVFASVNREKLAGKKFEIHTPNACAGVRGTEFYVHHKGTVSGITVKRGTVYSYNLKMPNLVRNVTAGKTTFVSSGNPPTNPRPASKSELNEHEGDTKLNDKKDTGDDDEDAGDDDGTDGDDGGDTGDDGTDGDDGGNDDDNTGDDTGDDGDNPDDDPAATGDDNPDQQGDDPGADDQPAPDNLGVVDDIAPEEPAVDENPAVDPEIEVDVPVSENDEVIDETGNDDPQPDPDPEPEPTVTTFSTGNYIVVYNHDANVEMPFVAHPNLSGMESVTFYTSDTPWGVNSGSIALEMNATYNGLTFLGNEDSIFEKLILSAYETGKFYTFATGTRVTDFGTPDYYVLQQNIAGIHLDSNNTGGILLGMMGGISDDPTVGYLTGDVNLIQIDTVETVDFATFPLQGDVDYGNFRAIHSGGTGATHYEDLDPVFFFDTQVLEYLGMDTYQISVSHASFYEQNWGVYSMLLGFDYNTSIVTPIDAWSAHIYSDRDLSTEHEILSLLLVGTSWNDSSDSNRSIAGNLYGYVGGSPEGVTLLAGEVMGSWFEYESQSFVEIASSGVHLSAEMFTDYLQNDPTKLADLGFPTFEVASIDFDTVSTNSSSGRILDLDVLGVKILANASGEIPVMWATSDVSGTFDGAYTPLAGDTLYLTDSNSTYSLKFEVMDFNTYDNKWYANVDNGSDPATIGGHNNIIFKGEVAGNISNALFYGTGGGIVFQEPDQGGNTITTYPIELFTNADILYNDSYAGESHFFSATQYTDAFSNIQILSDSETGWGSMDEMSVNLYVNGTFGGLTFLGGSNRIFSDYFTDDYSNGYFAALLQGTHITTSEATGQYGHIVGLHLSPDSSVGIISGEYFYSGYSPTDIQGESTSYLSILGSSIYNYAGFDTSSIIRDTAEFALSGTTPTDYFQSTLFFEGSYGSETIDYTDAITHKGQLNTLEFDSEDWGVFNMFYSQHYHNNSMDLYGSTWGGRLIMDSTAELQDQSYTEFFITNGHWAISTDATAWQEAYANVYGYSLDYGSTQMHLIAGELEGTANYYQPADLMFLETATAGVYLTPEMIDDMIYYDELAKMENLFFPTIVVGDSSGENFQYLSGSSTTFSSVYVNWTTFLATTADDRPVVWFSPSVYGYYNYLPEAGDNVLLSTTDQTKKVVFTVAYFDENSGAWGAYIDNKEYPMTIGGYENLEIRGAAAGSIYSGGYFAGDGGGVVSEYYVDPNLLPITVSAWLDINTDVDDYYFSGSYLTPFSGTQTLDVFSMNIFNDNYAWGTDGDGTAITFSMAGSYDPTVYNGSSNRIFFDRFSGGYTDGKVHGFLSGALSVDNTSTTVYNLTSNLAAIHIDSNNTAGIIRTSGADDFFHGSVNTPGDISMSSTITLTNITATSLDFPTLSYDAFDYGYWQGSFQSGVDSQVFKPQMMFLNGVEERNYLSSANMTDYTYQVNRISLDGYGLGLYTQLYGFGYNPTSIDVGDEQWAAHFSLDWSSFNEPKFLEYYLFGNSWSTTEGIQGYEFGYKYVYGQDYVVLNAGLINGALNEISSTEMYAEMAITGVGLDAQYVANMASYNFASPISTELENLSFPGYSIGLTSFSNIIDKGGTGSFSEFALNNVLFLGSQNTNLPAMWLTVNAAGTYDYLNPAAVGDYMVLQDASGNYTARVEIVQFDTVNNIWIAKVDNRGMPFSLDDNGLGNFSNIGMEGAIAGTIDPELTSVYGTGGGILSTYNSDERVNAEFPDSLAVYYHDGSEQTFSTTRDYGSFTNEMMRSDLVSWGYNEGTLPVTLSFNYTDSLYALGTNRIYFGEISFSENIEDYAGAYSRAFVSGRYIPSYSTAGYEFEQSLYGVHLDEYGTAGLLIGKMAGDLNDSGTTELEGNVELVHFDVELLNFSSFSMDTFTETLADEGVWISGDGEDIFSLVVKNNETEILLGTRKFELQGMNILNADWGVVSFITAFEYDPSVNLSVNSNSWNASAVIDRTSDFGHYINMNIAGTVWDTAVVSDREIKGDVTGFATNVDDTEVTLMVGEAVGTWNPETSLNYVELTSSGVFMTVSKFLQMYNNDTDALASAKFPVVEVGSLNFDSLIYSTNIDLTGMAVNNVKFFAHNIADKPLIFASEDVSGTFTYPTIASGDYAVLSDGGSNIIQVTFKNFDTTNQIWHAAIESDASVTVNSFSGLNLFGAAAGDIDTVNNNFTGQAGGYVK